MAQGLAVLPAFLEEPSSVPGTQVTVAQLQGIYSLIHRCLHSCAQAHAYS